MGRLLDALSLFWCYTKMTMKSWFQYKLNACIQSFTVFFRESTSVLIMYFTLQSFDNINGWNRDELFFLFSLLYITYGILIIFCTGLRDFDKIIADGRFDRFLLRPQGALFQVIASNADWFASLGQGGLGITLFIVCANRIGITWNLKTILYYLVVIISGTLIQVALFLFFATLSFYIVKSSNIRFLMYWQVRKFAGYPLSIFGTAARIFLMFIVPFAFVNYFPSQFLLRKADFAMFNPIWIYMSPVVALVWVLISYCFWRISIKRYTSTGT